MIKRIIALITMPVATNKYFIARDGFGKVLDCLAF